MTIKEYIDKFEDLYKYAKDIYPIEEMKSKKFKEGLYIILRCKLNLYTSIFRGQVEKAMEHEKLEQELEPTMRVRAMNHFESYGQNKKEQKMKNYNSTHILKKKIRLDKPVKFKVIQHLRVTA